MSTPPPSLKEPRKRRQKRASIERRGTPSDPGILDKLRMVKGALGRPLRVVRRGHQFHLVLVDRRRAPRSVAPLSVTQMCAELRERLLVHEHDHAAEVMRHLVFVHDVLGRKGWEAVEGLPARTIGKALVQAEMLVSQQGSQALSKLIERLRVLKVAANLRDERKAVSDDASEAKSMQVSESTHEDFEDLQRHWDGGLPA
ncbi:MAG: hypothetical protein ACKVOX_06015 [Rhizobacter sp.]